MPTTKSGRYHHGDLRSALIDTAIELIAAGGVRAFSMAAASRRLGVAVSAPYAHFADREELLAAVAVRAYEQFSADLTPGLGTLATPADALAAVCYAYVRFAGQQRALFEILFGLGLEKREHPEIEAAKRPILDTFLHYVRAVDQAENQALAVAVQAVSHGYALMLLDGDFGTEQEAVLAAAAQAARATRAVIEGRALLPEPSG
jgi:AcrR family transcriptional regulator